MCVTLLCYLDENNFLFLFDVTYLGTKHILYKAITEKIILVITFWICLHSHFHS